MASGAWESIVINGRRFTCKADDDVTFNLGGFKNEAIVQGDGSFTNKKERVLGKIDGINVNIDHDRGDAQFLMEARGEEAVPVTGTMVDGRVLSGNMIITSEGDISSAENTTALTLEGTLEFM